MSQRSKYRRQLHTLSDLQTIFKALKNISIVELQRVDQQSQNLAEIMSELERFQSLLRPLLAQLPKKPKGAIQRTNILIGTERGFCGPINRWLRDYKAEETSKKDRWLVIGSRLASLLNQDDTNVTLIEGAQTADDILDIAFTIKERLSEHLDFNQGPDIDIRLIRAFQGQDSHAISVSSILESPSENSDNSGCSVEYYLSDQQLLSGFLSYQIKYSILGALMQAFAFESRTRLTQVDSAMHRLEKKSQRLDQRLRQLRQEDITEEIETILLSEQFET